MVHAGVGGLDTPRTNVGERSYSSKEFDFDISQAPSFQSPSNDNNNIVNQMRKGGRSSIKTPRSRVALGDRRNLPAGLSGTEFTPLLKSATRNSALRHGKENTAQTPAFLRANALGGIPEDLPNLASSMYGDSRLDSIAGTPNPRLESSSTASTPMALLPRRNQGPGVLQDGNQLSLREQENVIDKIEKENFALKLKIHFLEEALHRSSPDFNQHALKENTELKVDKITMQKELIRYRKTLITAERDLELYRQQMSEMHEKVKQKHADVGQKDAMDRMQQALDDSEAEIKRLMLQVSKFEDLQERIEDLEADIREKNRLVEDREDEVENLKEEVEKHVESVSSLKEQLKKEQRRAIELEEKAQASEELEDAKELIEQLESDLKSAKVELQESKEEQEEAVKQRKRAQEDLEELQDEMANKSFTTKGLSRQIEEKVNRLQDEVEEFREKYATLEEDYAEKAQENEQLQAKVKTIKRESETNDKQLREKLSEAQVESRNASQQRDNLKKQLETTGNDLQQKAEEKNLLQTRHDALTKESTGLQKDLAKSRKAIEELEDKLNHEKTLALSNEREVRDGYKDEIDRLNDEIEDLRAEVQEKERLYHNRNDEWDGQRRTLESQKEAAEEKAKALQRAIGKLQQVEGNLSSKESKLKDALQAEKDRHASEEASLKRQIDELNDDVNASRKSLEEARFELLNVREELRLSQREQKLLAETVEGLEDEVEILQTSLDDESEQANQDIAAAKQESENLRRQLQILQQELARAESTANAARNEVDAFHANLQSDEGNRDILRSTLRDVEAQLSKLRLDKQSLQDQLATMTVEMHALRLSKSEAEAERDEVQSQVKAMKQQEEETFRLDQERVDLRTSKLKLDAEVRRLKEETKAAISQQESVERELQREIERASAEEARLSNEIHDLQKILRGSSEKRELSAARKTIQQMEERIRQLEDELLLGQGYDDAAHELSIIRQDLSSARQRETEFLQREASQKETLRGLRRQIIELEQKVHDAEVSRLVASSPHSSVSGSARKTEIVEVRAQLAAAHQSLKEVRSRLKSVEKESACKLNAINNDYQARVTEWEAEKDDLERAIDEAELTINDLSAKNTASEANIARLRNKIDRLEKALQAERQNTGEDRTMVLERKDLHEMLRETQVQVETFERDVNDRDNTIAIISAAEEQLRAQVKRIREERSLYRSQATSAQNKVKELERQFKEAEQDWDAEKKKLSKERSEVSGTQVQLKVLEQQFLEVRESLEIEKNSVSKYRSSAASAQMELKVLEQKFKEAEDSWKVERKKLSRKAPDDSTARLETKIEFKVLERQFKTARENWDAEKKTLSDHCYHFTSAQLQLQALEQQFKEARESWEAEKKKLTQNTLIDPTSVQLAQAELKNLERRFRESQEKWNSEREALQALEAPRFQEAQEKWSHEREALQLQLEANRNAEKQTTAKIPSRRSSMKSPAKDTDHTRETTTQKRYSFTEHHHKTSEHRQFSETINQKTDRDNSRRFSMTNLSKQHIDGSNSETAKPAASSKYAQSPRPFSQLQQSAGTGPVLETDSTTHATHSVRSSPSPSPAPRRPSENAMNIVQTNSGSIVLNLNAIDKLMRSKSGFTTAQSELDKMATKSNITFQKARVDNDTLTTNFTFDPESENNTRTSNFTMRNPGLGKDNTGTDFSIGHPSVGASSTGNTVTTNFSLGHATNARNMSTILLPNCTNSFALQDQLDDLEQRLRQAEQGWEQEKHQLQLLETTLKQKEHSWEVERQKLTSGVRFVNTSLSTVNNDHEAEVLKKHFIDKENTHIKEIRGMQLQIEWLRARCHHEEGLRNHCGAAKRYMGAQLDKFSAWNHIDTVGSKKTPKFKLKAVAQAIRAMLRMKKMASKWRVNTQVRDRLLVQSKKQKKARRDQSVLVCDV